MERDINKAFVLVIMAAVLADILTHGTEFNTAFSPLLRLVNSAFSVAAGRGTTTV